MNYNSLPTYQDFRKSFESKKLQEAEGFASKKLQKAITDYHEAQLKLQELQNEFVKTAKENPNKREELKQAIITQNKTVKSKESLFKKALGDEDIEDFEI
jgi:hypothetical protein